MKNSSGDNRKILIRVLYVIIVTAVIYLSIPFARSLEKYLNNRELFNKAVYVSLALFAAICFFVILRYTGFRLANFLWLAAFFAGYFQIVRIYDNTAEKIHFVQYGILAFFVYHCLRLKIKNNLIYPASIAIVSIVGWGDEVIQLFVPKRYYDIRDVILNALAGGLILALIFISEKVRGLNPGIASK